MKGLIFTYEGYPNTNIGDYIQSLAAKQFFPEDFDVIFHHRDELNSYKGDEVKVIMNGWFTHKPENWPPSDNINPLFVAFHINSSAYQQLLSKDSLAYLKRYQPIGCRDEMTAKLLQEHGVDAYFSSCLTTTLGYKYKTNNIERDKIYIVDPVHYVPEANSRFRKYKFLFYYLRYYKGINRYIKSLKANNNYDLCFCKKNLSRYMSIIRSYIVVRQILSPEVLKEAVILTQYHYADEYPTNEQRFARAEELIKLYSTAKLVITSRIHCALPCLGLETPVVFLKNLDDSQESLCRFDGLLNLMNIISFRKNKVIDSPFILPISMEEVKVKKDYRPFSVKLIDRVCSFLDR